MSKPHEIPDLPEGMHYDAEYGGLTVEGVVARQVADHIVLPRPGRRFSTCTLDHLSGNTIIGMHLARVEPGGTKCGHRHLDETMTYIVSGHGWSEYRQNDDAPLTRVDWEAGDVLVIPCNSFHEHHNGDPNGYARQLSFRNTRFLNRILQNEQAVYRHQGAVYTQASRFHDRFDDEPDYFTTQEVLPNGAIRTNYIKQVVSQPLPAEDPELGQGVALQRYILGGQRTLDPMLVGIRAGGHVRPHRLFSEQGMLILQGSGRTEFWDEHGSAVAVSWRAGDVVAPPLGVWRQHLADAHGDVRYLAVSDTIIPNALEQDVRQGLDIAIPNRFPSFIEPGA